MKNLEEYYKKKYFKYKTAYFKKTGRLDSNVTGGASEDPLPVRRREHLARIAVLKTLIQPKRAQRDEIDIELLESATELREITTDLETIASDMPGTGGVSEDSLSVIRGRKHLARIPVLQTLIQTKRAQRVEISTKLREIATELRERATDLDAIASEMRASEMRDYDWRHLDI